MEKEIFLSVVIPAYKEEKRISKILEAILKYQKDHQFNMEVIVVIDGSPDKTDEIVDGYKNKISNLIVINRAVNKGKGYTVREGMMKARGKYALFADSDNSTPFEQLDKLLKYSETHDVIIGSRYCRGGELARPQPLYRIIGTRILNLIIQILAVRGIHDTQCGFKLFNQKALKEIFSRQTLERFSFDIELLAIAKRLNLKIKEVGIKWYDDPHSTVSPIKDGISFVKHSILIRKNIIKGVYK